MVWAAIVWYSILLVLLLPFMAELLQGNSWTGIIRCIPRSWSYFRKTMQLSKNKMPPSTQLELFSHGLKNMKVNLNTFPGHHNGQIWTSLNNSGQFWRLEWGTDLHLQPSLKKIEDDNPEGRYKVALETVQNVYEPIPKRTAVECMRWSNTILIKKYLQSL
jgi:hypothetical protein